MSLKDYYKKHDEGIWVAGFMIVTLIISMSISYHEGYNNGMDDTPRPEYGIQMYTMDLNYTMYNQTYHMLTHKDVRSDNWVLNLENRTDYFMVGVSIETKSDNWSRFFLSIDRYNEMTVWNLTIELVSIMTYYSSGYTHIYNFYDGAYGGTLCNKRATVYFLGYGNITTDIGGSISSSIKIRGHFG